MPSMSSQLNLQGQKSCINPHNANKEEAIPYISFFRGNGYGRSSGNLDMYTETLGCESGAMCSDYEVQVAGHRKKIPQLTNGAMKQISASPTEFPPPLTTLRGEGRLRLGSKREEGRLLLIPFKPFLLEAERLGGRLQLWFLPGGAAKGIGEIEAEEKVEDELIDEGEDGVEEKGCLVYFGSGGKYRRPVWCKEEEGERVGRTKRTAAAFFNCDAFLIMHIIASQESFWIGVYRRLTAPSKNG